jgi:hypothetical protein
MCSDEDCDSSRRPNAEDRRWSHISGTLCPDDWEVKWCCIWSAADTWRLEWISVRRKHRRFCFAWVSRSSKLVVRVSPARSVSSPSVWPVFGFRLPPVSTWILFPPASDLNFCFVFFLLPSRRFFLRSLGGCRPTFQALFLWAARCLCWFSLASVRIRSSRRSASSWRQFQWVGPDLPFRDLSPVLRGSSSSVFHAPERVLSSRFCACAQEC